METFIAIVHIIVALSLISLILIQDTKSGSMGSAFGGGGSNSVFGATGAATLASKLTQIAAIIFALTCIALTVMSARSNRSIIDGTPVVAPVETPAATTTTNSDPTAPGTATEAPAAAQPEKK